MPASHDIGLVLRAAQFAAIKHRDQRRKDKTPYTNHPLALADVLWREGGIRDARILAAALLHDTVEDTKTTRAELQKAFGRPIASIVSEVTDDKRLQKKTRKGLTDEHAPHLSAGAKLGKRADKF